MDIDQLYLLPDGAMERGTAMVVAAMGGPEAWRGEQHPVCSNICYIRIFY